MTLRIIDGFDYLPSGASNNDDSILKAMGWSGDVERISRKSNVAFEYGYSLGIGGNVNNIHCYKDLRGRYTSDVVDYVIWGTRMYVDTDSPIMDFTFYDTLSSTIPQFNLDFTNTGNIKFSNTTYGTVTTPAWTFYPGRWFYFEVKWKPGLGTDGFIEIRVNTVVVLSIPNCQTAMGTPYGGYPGVDVLYCHSGGASSGDHNLDDMYFLDSLGAQNNDYLGNVRVKAQMPIGESAVQWAIGGTSPASTNWESVLNATLDGTTFVYSVTPGDRDLYVVDPNISSPYIYGMEIDGIYRQDDATQRVVRNTYQTDLGTDEYGVDHYTYGFYVTQYDIFELNPDTGVAFTQSEINNILIGPEVVS